MGLYDREYSREPEPGFHMSAPQSVTTQIVVVTVGVYLAQLAFPQVTSALELESDWWRRPWTCYQLLTYGFLHDPRGIEHILINMLVFWMFGREIEMRYGRREFVAFYFIAIIIAGLAWSLSETLVGAAEPHGIQLVVDAQGRLSAQPSRLPPLVGASGGIAGIFALYALNFPHRQVLFMFFLPMPMWVAALIALAFDVYGAMDRSGNVACVAHLAGALFGLCYYRFGWRLGGMFSNLGSWTPRGKPRLRVHEPDEEDDLSLKVDEILKKIQEQGQDSLTASERRILEKASRRYQEKRR
jgi:membrane associated rhomboid family serine protease